LGGFAGWVIVDDEFEATGDDLVETHLVVGGEVIGDLDLDRDHGDVGARVRASTDQGRRSCADEGEKVKVKGRSLD